MHTSVAAKLGENFHKTEDRGAAGIAVIMVSISVLTTLKYMRLNHGDQRFLLFEFNVNVLVIS